ncbi:putative mitochondrial protein [Cucumis melo var. makuwa]|uniref:Putative mitochondrial protein n=1 Tax=Cucumis melo var. makuwa TaxID=1194695 RepID=A0A5D3C3B2_CUCMM|nr:putative mitochondrial protein [Cucumis melo var. makuwa]
MMQLYHDVLLLPRRPREDGLSLLVEKPWPGAFADHWPRLDNNSVLPRLSVEIPLSEGKSAWVLQSSIHNEAPNSGRALTLGQRLIEGQTRWGTVTKVPEEFCFTDCYWEWLERNDRSTSSKNDSQVTIGSWISFWYLGLRSYDKPTTRKQKKASRSKSTQNSDGWRIQAREWSPRESMLFTELGIRDDLKDEMYLVAFLSCWLCLFVFLQKGSFLRPGVFRAASLMATDTIYSLAVPVSVNIYHGLGDMPPAITLDNILYHWRICTRRNTLSELYLSVRKLEPCKHVTQQFTDWWTTRHRTYFEDNRHPLALTPNLEEEVKEHKDESDSSKSDRHWKRPLKKAKVSGDNPDERGLSAFGVPDVPPLSPLNDHLKRLIELGSDESLTRPYAVDSAFEEVGISKTSVNKPTEQSLRPSALLEEIRRGK